MAGRWVALDSPRARGPVPDDALPPPRRRRPSRATTRDSQGPNVLLAALPARAYAALAPHLVSLSLAAGDELYAPGAALRPVYFPDSAVLSMRAGLDEVRKRLKAGGGGGALAAAHAVMRTVRGS